MPTMFKCACMLLLLFGVIVNAQTPKPCPTNINCPPTAMPEPSGIPDLLLGLAGVAGLVAWRKRKTG